MVQALQQALIVDDSKTARVTLRKMLEKHQIAASLVESGEEALDFLRHQCPDVIFMDHMMPGMDGFAAVKAIKSDPATAAIPIVMHTTKEGDIYTGQARALGAIALLSKPATDHDLLAVLNQIRQAAPLKPKPAIAVHTNGNAGTRGKSAGDTIELDAYAVAMAAEMAAARQRRNGGDDAVDVASPTPPPRSVIEPMDGEGDSGFWGNLRQWVVALVWLVPITWLLALYLPAEKQLRTLTEQRGELIKTVAWLANQSDSYDFGEAPLSEKMLGLLQGLVPRLAAAGFTGVIRLEGHIGEFCLSSIRLADGSDIAMLPEPDQSLASCAMIGYGPVQAVRESVAQSEGFRTYLKRAGLLAEDAPIRVEIVGMGSSRPAHAYPEELETLTTGDWNAVALRNNRVRVELVPDAPALKDIARGM